MERGLNLESARRTRLVPGFAHRLPVKGIEDPGYEEQEDLVNGPWDGQGADHHQTSDWSRDSAVICQESRGANRTSGEGESCSHSLYCRARRRR